MIQNVSVLPWLLYGYCRLARQYQLILESLATQEFLQFHGLQNSIHFKNRISEWHAAIISQPCIHGALKKAHYGRLAMKMRYGVDIELPKKKNQHKLIHITFSQHITNSHSTLGVSTLHKQLQQIPISSLESLVVPPSSQCLSPALHM